MRKDLEELLATPIPDVRGKWQRVAAQMSAGDSVIVDSWKDRQSLMAVLKKLNGGHGHIRDDARHEVWKH